MSNMQYVGNQGSANTINTGEGLSPFLWKNFPIEDVRNNRNLGFFRHVEFDEVPDVAAGSMANYGPLKGFASTGGSAADAGIIGGAKVLSSDGDNEGASIQMGGTSIQIAQGKGRAVFEARIKTSTITDTKHGFIIGLAEALTLSATVPITALGAISDNNIVGFMRLEGDGDQLDTVYKCDGVAAVTVQADALTTALVADTWVKVGFEFNPNDNSLTFYVNGVALATTKTIPSAAGTDFPNDVLLAPVFAVLNATGTTPGNSTIDWWAYGQLAA